jgi:hypothetical protein
MGTSRWGNAGIRDHHSGAIPEADPRSREVLDRDPRFPDAAHARGADHQRGGGDATVAPIRKTIALNASASRCHGISRTVRPTLDDLATAERDRQESLARLEKGFLERALFARTRRLMPAYPARVRANSHHFPTAICTRLGSGAWTSASGRARTGAPAS